MTVVKRNLKLVKYSIICVMLFLVLGSGIAVAGEEATADDSGTVDGLFELFLDGWVSPMASLDTVDADVNKAFLAELRDARRRFGHLPEYWELMAHIYLRRADISRDIRGGNWVDFAIQNDIYLKMNPKMLEKALMIDPSRAAALWNIGRINALDAWPDWHAIDFLDRYDATPTEYLRFYADGLSSAGAVDPGNGYYPFFEAVKRYRLGDSARAIELFKNASECKRFSQPAMFPRSYALSVMDDFKEGVGLFSDFSCLERDFFGSHFYFPNTPENLLELKKVYREIVKEPGDDWQETFTILNAAACSLGQNDFGDSIYQLIGISLIKICRDEALTIAKDSGDKNLEIALLALWHEAENVRTRLRIENSVEDRTCMLMKPIFEELFEFELSQENTGEFADYIRYLQEGPYTVEDMEWTDWYLTDMMMGIVYIIKEIEFTDKHIWHLFDRMAAFDYEDPLWWYVWWEMEGRYSPAKDEESYRERCWT